MGGDVSVFWSLTELLVQPFKRWSIGRLQGPAGEHKLVGGVGAVSRLLQPVVLILKHVQHLDGLHPNKRPYQIKHSTVPSHNSTIHVSSFEE